MLAIRLSRFGKKNRPVYRLIVSDKTKDPKATYIESLGLYDPREGAKVTNLKEERLKYWIEKGAQLSATVNNLLVGQGALQGEKVKKVKVKKSEEKKEEPKPKEEKKPEPEKAS
ncbi:30S ribosomal protein S16 [Candidatus Falkowbacteria bacterium RIFOXYB2_FULL_38_15]|uniref:Small ribosomal subunit protein bS16 n=1 Tax=Candidatus Falkowbacteria bacterium RIFOXYA2_FULL_38_12 TaxID=1797993 RepID=A0A1F5S4S6_9BACT|nr:MAG: 30S ribosomal protein S16 [Candidatus Falkowbacteria bacterium RIFOXYA2_FULL_38_12]OGF32632.1 MAG: 30S ribosomal protein S16 [Candidatus Falkowbacteria bacterium RIFOXYB2_FULL_38_15]OGF44560.1 MAG: 30S ribosomal protein S16 [Candidatus Falkowbacteria bacterium RIFOXYD2_FULL_39_16]